MSILNGDARRLHWPDCRNVRDLGGLPAIDGRLTRQGALIRADSLDRLTAEGVRLLRELGAGRILDLRSAAETELRPHPFAGEDIYRLVPMIDPKRERRRDRRAERTLGEIYSSSLVRNAQCIVDGLVSIADAPAGAVVVHCAVGKDRTGIIAALALSLAGVPDEIVADDYALSADCLREEFDEILAELGDEVERAHVLERMSCRPGTILAMLAHARDRYESVEGYLLAHGFGAGRVKRLRDRLLAD